MSINHDLRILELLSTFEGQALLAFEALNGTIYVDENNQYYVWNDLTKLYRTETKKDTLARSILANLFIYVEPAWTEYILQPKSVCKIDN
jgi:hypothetical protein